MSWVLVVVFGVVPLVRAQAKPAASAPAVEKPAPVETAWNNPLPSGRLTMGMHFGDQQVESYGDIIVPVIQFKSGLLFVNPRGAWNDSDGQEFNFGLGYRQLLPGNTMIVGANLYYDLRNTSLDNTFNQFGGGLEFLSKWVDVRGNFYIPESDKKTANEYLVSSSTVQEQGSYWANPTGQGHQITQFGYDITSTYEVKTLQHYQISERAMEGYDAELGLLLPIPVVKDYADIKVFGGYYDFNAHYGEDIAGMKGRLEIKPMPALYLDAAWYEDKELLGSSYSVGFRLSVPFDLANLSRGKNPFAGALDGFKPGAATPNVASRMTEMVMRDLHIRTDMSEAEEIVANRRMLDKKLLDSDRQDYNLVLASDVTFVDDDNTGLQDGTWENPYRQINTGVQNAVGTMVYVRDAAQQYYENVVLREGLTLWGSGAPIYGRGNRFLGGIYPVVNGLGRGPVITLANGVTVAGFEITQTAPAYSSETKKPDMSLAGIYGENVTDVRIQQNYIHGSGATGHGIYLSSHGVPSLVATIANNRIDDVRGNGIGVNAYGVDYVDLTLANNNVTRCDWNGVSIDANGEGGVFIARISGNYSGNLNDGVDLSASGFDMAAALFVDTVANDNQATGLDVNLYDNDLSAVLLASHADLERADQLVKTVVGGLPILPIDLDGFSVGDLLGVRGLYRDGGSMQANGNGSSGINVTQQSGGVNIAALIGVQADNNGERGDKDGGGSGIEIYQGGYNGNPDISVAALIRCEASGNGGPGMRVSSYADSLALNLFMDVKANDNQNYGIRSSVYSYDGWAGSVVLSSDPVLSLIETITGNPMLEGMVSPMDMSFIPAYGQVQANGNAGSGIYIDAQGRDGAFGVVLDAQANGNGLEMYRPGNGIQLELHSSEGPVLGLVSSSEALMELAGTLLEAGEVPLDLSQVRTLGPVQANNNRENGVYISAHGHDDAIVGVLGVEALRNGVGITGISEEKNGIGGDGILLDVSSEYRDAMVGLAWINASENGSDGIYANVRANWSYGEAMLGGINITANNNGNNGLELDVQSASYNSSYLVLAGVEANGNIYGSGIDAWLGGPDTVMAALTDIQANSNGAHGVSVATDSYNGDSHVWISDTAVQDMSDHGGGWDLLGLDIIPMLPAGGIEAGGNGDNGIYIDANSSGEILVDVADVTASGNRHHGVLAELDANEEIEASFADIVANDNGNGLRVEAYSGQELESQLKGEDGNPGITLSVENVRVSGSRNNGIATIMGTSGQIDAKYLGNVAVSNGEDGLRIKGDAGGRFMLLGEDNVARDNVGDGIDVKTSAASGKSNRQYDFGGGVLGSRGYNVVENNGGYDMEWTGGGKFSARTNFWGEGVTPALGSEYNNSDMYVDGALTDDPTVLP
jgi:hypothetical protein